ncbi:MAG TPA: HAD-IA family hydrolase [Candidatus Babeliales bacterium]|jgi:FMN phosphatase YigB (HAD superfamily)|nr:HAD-IA family hydrolase [Candidatus Babeliales bacterium]
MNQPQFSPDTHIFLWDLHDVILEKSLANWFMSCMRFKRKKEIIRHINTKTIKIAFLFLLEKLKFIKKQMVSEELITAAQATNNEALIELTMLVCSSYSPIKKTVTLMQELSDLGYTHHLGSNIGKTVFDDCTQKFPHIFNLFKEATIPFEHATKMIKKPHPDFFHAHIKKHNLQPEQIIFIDDKLINVQAAQSVGMHAIHFKNAHQLRKELIKKNILKL